jgi:hypothetical protein
LFGKAYAFFNPQLIRQEETSDEKILLILFLVCSPLIAQEAKVHPDAKPVSPALR